MGTYRKRWNEKARAGQMSKLHALRKVRNKQFTKHEDDSGAVEDAANESDVIKDTNAEILEPLSKEEKEEKKRRLQEEFTPTDSKISQKKKKRLEKFIEHQLKREERKTIIEKLQAYKVDTSILTSSKKLGQGRQTKKEEFEEALKLERQGRGDESTKEILYEEKEHKNWHTGEDNEDDSEGCNGDKEEFISTTQSSGGFIDNRPSKFGGSGAGFGFSNVTVVKKRSKHNPKKKYNWRERVEQEEKRKHKIEDDMDFDSSSEEESETSATASSDETSSKESEEDVTSNKVDKFKVSKSGENFKEWAINQIKKMEGRDVEYVTPKLNVKYEPIYRPEDLEDGLQEDDIPVNKHSQRKAFVVEVDRSDSVQAVRMQLPVFSKEHDIMEAIHHNDVVIICGETGSGKTTQVPQFLYESGYGHPDSPENPGMIGITQPRRVAAVSMANRVSDELGSDGAKVAYQIRFDSTVKEDTRMKFMTDGVLLREMMHDFKLSKYSAIIIDEAHERNINTDILLGMLSRCVKLRSKENRENPELNKKLKVIIMSATLRVSDFSENRALFSTPPPILKVDGRQYPVSIHFNRKTSHDYLEEAFKKTCKIHRRLPPGSILVFMTGQQEITHMVKKLREEFPFGGNEKDINKDLPTIRFTSKEADLEAEDIEFSTNTIINEEFDDGLDSGIEEEEEEGFTETLEEGQTANDPLYVLPLYSLLPTKEQIKVFRQPPKGSRLCVVATNVAETSLTIPGIRYVVDCGRSKERKYDESTGVQSFEIDWISKASADQRSGRAGRTGPGHCYRLYSSAVYERDFEQFSQPEILRMPVENVVLQMKSMSIHRITNFPFPTPPDPLSLSKAIYLLQHLGALDENEKITIDGRKMSLFPLSPRFSKMLLVGNDHNCLPYVVSIVSGLSVGDPFFQEHEVGLDNNDSDAQTDETEDLSTPIDERKRALRVKYFKSRSKFSKLDKYSDVFRLLSAICALDYIPIEHRTRFMHDNFLRVKTLNEILKLRKQVMYIIKSNTSKQNAAVAVRDEEMKAAVPNETQVKLLKQMICAGFVDQVAIRADLLFPGDANITSKSKITDIPYIPVLAQRTANIQDIFAFIHPGSILSSSGEQPPNYLVFHSLYRNTNAENPRTRMRLLCDIKSTPLANVAKSGSLLTYSKPLTTKTIKPIDISPFERYCYLTPRFGASIDSDIKIGWELNPIAVHQKKIQGKWHVSKFITSTDYKNKALKMK
ncbi:HFL089Cp [Eremothecium sinecaudum]|uniref:RNA helicase n=1 Tax=Eremothecium sinecaudum TaxID=45286 RepID=A0A120K2K0_9SACH|nr:HFL089Cp [Eremothecium sinecaudum]AMD21767.1 HFL089Cp [Eremothecium sinecaudum]